MARPNCTYGFTDTVAKIALGQLDCLMLGNIDARRDWGFAREYVEGMWRIVQQDEPDDFVLATGETHTVREFVELAFKEVGITLEWNGRGEHEVGRCTSTGAELVAVDPRYYRPTEVDLLIGGALCLRSPGVLRGASLRNNSAWRGGAKAEGQVATPVQAHEIYNCVSTDGQPRLLISAIRLTLGHAYTHSSLITTVP